MPRNAGPAPFKEIGERIKTLRLHHRLTQTELASRLSTSQGHYWRIESGRLLPSTEFLQKLQSEFGVSPNEIMLAESLPSNGEAPSSMASDVELDDAARDRVDVQIRNIQAALMLALGERVIREADVINMIADARTFSPMQLKAMTELRNAFVHGQIDAGVFLSFLDKTMRKEPTAAPPATAGTSYAAPKIATRAAEIMAEEHAAQKDRLTRSLARPVSGALVPLVRIAAGLEIEAIGSSDTGEYAARPPWLEDERIDGALKIVGDSMNDEGLCEGDIVFVRNRAWQSGGIAVARRVSTNDFTIKQVFKRGPNELELRALSKRAIPPMRWPAKDTELVGVEIVGSWRPSWHTDDEPHLEES